ncbi:MAG: hypothetical protein B6D61_00615 [Bacteroidetes bacterium 4484_249]|nr:MAG: hypothetical protein B6D61_00615 [Bacteroidetes bacterium 4484_249]
MRIVFIITGFYLILNSYGQLSVSDSTLNIPMFYATYTFQMPGGDMADRFGNNSGIGGGFKWKTDKNWIFGAEFIYIFGNDVKIADQIMNNLKTSEGGIIDMAGNFTSYSLYERGYYISGRFGKVFPVISPNPNSGIVIMGSVGYFQHKIKIEVTNNSAPQLNDDYKKGYDRLTGGIGVSEFIGYMYISDSRLLNFFAGFEFNQAWTSPQRDVNFDTMKPDEISNRFDSLMGIKIGWIIPLFKRLPEKYYYY